MKLRLLVFLILLAPLPLRAWAAEEAPRGWKNEWPKTDFSRSAVAFEEILSGGPPRDGIPSIDRPKYESVDRARKWLDDRSPVISLSIGGEARAWPLAILMYHEIVNDRFAGVPIAVTYCPLCNAAIVFRRELAGRELSFGTTGKLRNSDLVMYDRETESWWQQFTGEAIIGTLTGEKLERLPSRLESFARFRARHPDGRVLRRPFSRNADYGSNPYIGYDSASRPFLYDGRMPEGIHPLMRVVSVGDRAWTLDYLRRKGRIETADGLVLSWEEGQASALDAPLIADSRDVGNVTVVRRTPEGMMDVVHGIDFAFAFHAFHPDAEIIDGD